MQERKKPGPPSGKDIVGTPKRINVNLDEETHHILRTSGYGGVSQSIRLIVKDWARRSKG